MSQRLSEKYERKKLLKAWARQARGEERVLNLLAAGRAQRATTLLYEERHAEVNNALAAAWVACRRLHDCCADTFLGWPFYELLTHIQRSIMDAPLTMSGTGLKPYSDHILHPCIVAQLGIEVLRKAEVSHNVLFMDQVIHSLNDKVSCRDGQVWEELSELADAVEAHWYGELQVMPEILLAGIPSLFSPESSVRGTVSQRVEDLWCTGALYHDVGYHIASVNVILGENAPRVGHTGSTYSILESIRQSKTTGKFEDQLWRFAARVSPYDFDTLVAARECMFQIQKLSLTPEDYNDLLFVKLGQLHPFWSAEELIRTASDLGESEAFETDPSGVFQKQVMLALAAADVCTHHILSLGDLSEVEFRGPEEIQEMFRCLSVFQEQARSLTFNDWPLGFLLHVLDSCDVLSRIRLRKAETVRLRDERGVVREIRVAIVEEPGKPVLQFDSPGRSAGLSIGISGVEMLTDDDLTRFEFFQRIVHNTAPRGRRNPVIRVRLTEN